MAGAFALARRDAVEQSLQTFAEEHIGVSRRLGAKRVNQRRVHRPEVEIDAPPPGRSLLEGRVNMVWTALQARDVETASTKGAHDSRGRRGFAAAGAGRDYDEAGRRHSGIRLASKARRSPTIAPIIARPGETAPPW